MKLIDALEFIGNQRPAWKARSGWNPPFCYNRDHIIRLLGANKDVRKITKADLATMRNTLLSEPSRQGNKRRSIGGVNRVMAMVNTLLRDLEENEIIDRAPRLKGLPENNTRTGYFRRDQVEEMIRVSQDVFENDLLADAILTAVFTGCRQSELLNLTVADVDLHNDQVMFRDTKNGSDHLLDIHAELRPVLRRRTRGKQPTERVFDFENDDQLRRQFFKVRDVCGLGNEMVWHTFRHTTGTWLAERGVPLQTIAAVLNHKTISTTHRYAKATDKARRAAINSL